jgi:FAD dependent oxidoreductase
MNRRTFLERLGLGASTFPFASTFFQALALPGSGVASGAAATEIKADVAIIGGGLGGVAAALAAARNGLTVILTEETDWIGGQVTQQAVPLDEHSHIEAYGSTRTYRNYRNRVRDYYRRNYPLTEAARERWNLSLGNGSMPLTHEPLVSLAVFYEMLAPYIGSTRLTILLNTKAVSATMKGDRVQAVTVHQADNARNLLITVPYFLDATELGDLLPLTGTEYVTGSDARAATGELHAGESSEAGNEQCVTYCFAMDYLEGEDHTIEKPSSYDEWKNFVPQMRPPYTGRLLSFDASVPANPSQIRPGYLDPSDRFPKPKGKDDLDLWTYRRLIDKKNFVEGTYRSDITLVNWPQNDYTLGRFVDVSPQEFERQIERSKQLSLSLLYWMQTAAPRTDGGIGFPGLRLRPDLVGTVDGLAKFPYIREARRIRAEFTILEQHVGEEMRKNLPFPANTKGERFFDSVGVGYYHIDLHPSTGGDNYIDIPSLPFEIPLGALIPRRVENLVPVSKNIGTTHISNGCYRLHPVEWGIGEAGGMLAAFCSARKLSPRQVRNDRALLTEFQGFLQKQGVELSWPD